MTKILIIRDKTLSFNGGIKRHCHELEKLMDGYKNINILPIEDIPCKYLKLAHKFKYEKKALREYILDSKCDIVHIHGFMSIGTVQAIKEASELNKKILYSPHFHPFQYLQNPLLGKLFFYGMIRPVLHKVHTIITINNEDTAFFQRFHSKVIKVPHWVTKSDITTEKCNKRKNNMLLFIGRNDENKGLEHLYQLPSIYQVHCVTKGPLKRHDFILHERISDTELNKLYDETSAVIVPSRYEAFSLVALEALSHHTPIIISDRVRIGDYLTGGKGYKIFKYHNYDDFNQSVKEILSSNDIINYNKLLSPFNATLVREKYYHIYNS